ncbi:MAG TPA: hypothetical protein VL172_04785, partial [Kofleriaceae bacterium]|nr:hypothetical protein [Kofleriaceae bacterium]
AVLPVTEPARFAAAVGGRPHGDGWKVGDMLCAARPAGFVCGADDDGIAAALAPGDRRLRTRVAAVPSTERGDLELVADLAAMPDMAGVRRRLGAMLREPGLVVAALRGGDDVELRLSIEGGPVAPWGTLLAEPALLPALDAAELGAPGGMRVRFALPQLLAFVLPPTALPDHPDLSAVLLDLFTGDLLVSARGRGPFAGELALGIIDADAVRAVLPGLCRDPLGVALGRVRRAAPDRCRILVDLPPERARDPLASAALELIDGSTIDIAIDGPLLRISGGAAGGGPMTRTPAALDREGWQLRAWAAVPDPLLGLPAPLRARVDARLAELPEAEHQRLAALRGLADQLAGAALAARIDDRGLHLLLAAEPLLADPPEARRAWADALAAERAGDLDGFRARLAALRQAQPRSRAAAQAALVLDGAPALGPGGVLLVAALIMTRS